MTRKQCDIDMMVLLAREKAWTRDIASMFSVTREAVQACMRSHGFLFREMRKLPPLPEKVRNRIIRKFCKKQSKFEALCAMLDTYHIRFEDFMVRPLLEILKHSGVTYKVPLPVVSERNKEVAELRRQGMTLKSIGQRYGISRERVRQIVLRFNEISDDPVDTIKVRQTGQPQKTAKRCSNAKKAKRIKKRTANSP